MNEKSQQKKPNSDDGRRTRHQHRRPELVSALASYYLEHGLAEHSLRPVAAAIGVSHSTLLRHFRTKEELIAEVVQKITTDFVLKMLSDMNSTAHRNLSDFLASLWKRMNEPFETQHFLFLFEIAAREGRQQTAQSNVGRMLTDDLIDPLRDKFIEDFAIPMRDAAALAHLTAAQIRGLMIDLALGGERSDGDYMMSRFIELIDPSRQNSWT